MKGRKEERRRGKNKKRKNIRDKPLAFLNKKKRNLSAYTYNTANKHNRVKFMIFWEDTNYQT